MGRARDNTKNGGRGNTQKGDAHGARTRDTTGSGGRDYIGSGGEGDQELKTRSQGMRTKKSSVIADTSFDEKDTSGDKRRGAYYCSMGQQIFR